MFAKLRKNRSFSYTPRVYNPEKEKMDNIKQGRRPLRFHRTGAKSSGRSIIMIVASIGFILYLIHLLSQVGSTP